MGFLSSIWNGLIDGLESILRFYEGLLEPFSGEYAWGLSIILLTVTVRIFLIPLMVRQTKSMRAMQQLQPELKRIKEKYKADRSMMKTDPDRYKKLKEKEREAQMALYQEHQVNPVGGCLPLILQMPIFFALFRVLQDDDRVAELATAPFLGIDSLANTAQGGAGIGAFVLVILQVATTYYTQRQMQARTTGTSSEQAQAQKMMMYIMPVFLGYLSFSFPIGVVLYWVTTNVWTIGQQYFIFKRVEADEAQRADERASQRADDRKAQRGKAASSGAGSSGVADAATTSADDVPNGAGGPKGSDGRGPKGGAPKSTSKGGGSKGGGSKDGMPNVRKGPHGEAGSGGASNGKGAPAKGGSAASGPRGGRRKPGKGSGTGATSRTGPTGDGPSAGSKRAG